MNTESQPKIISASLDASGLKFAIVASRFNQFLVERLVEGAQDALVRHGAKINDLTIVWVPGAWEIPVVTQRIARQRQFNGIVCVGVLIKGSTYHFDMIANEACNGIGQIALENGIPIAMGILTTDSLTQAIERSGTTMGNQGYSAAMAAIEVANIFRQID
jgi:6,7-dimethyl-8-ribityllumazine synthase